MKTAFFLVLTCLLFSRCMEFEDPDFGGISNFKMDSFSGGELKCSFDAQIGNPNKFGIKLKPTVLDVFADDMMIGKLHLDNRIKFKRKSDKVYNIPLRVKLENGMVMKLMGLMTRSNVKLRFVGKVKASVYGFTKKVDIDKSKDINPSELKGMFNGGK
jgi:LEA14-like dessication related protein